MNSAHELLKMARVSISIHYTHIQRPQGVHLDEDFHVSVAARTDASRVVWADDCTINTYLSLLTTHLLTMAPVLTKKNIKEFLAAGNDIAIPILSLVKDTSFAFPPLHYAAAGALFIASNVKVSNIHPNYDRCFS